MSRIPNKSKYRKIRRIKAIEIMNASSSVAVDSNDIEAAIMGYRLSNKWAKKGSDQVSSLDRHRKDSSIPHLHNNRKDA